jgi:hypothetical protein
VLQRFRIYSDAETDAFLKENKNKNTGQKTKSDMKKVTDFFRSVGEFRDPATIPSSELDSWIARFFLGVRKRDFSESKYRQFRMFWCKICYNLSRNDFTIIF